MHVGETLAYPEFECTFKCTFEGHSDFFTLQVYISVNLMVIYSNTGLLNLETDPKYNFKSTYNMRHNLEQDELFDFEFVF